jgi:pectinesterase
MKYIVKANEKIQRVIDQANEGDTILIGPGVYEEKLVISKHGLHLIGSTDGEVKITYNDYALKDHEDGRRFGTFRSYTCLVEGDNIVLENICIENSSGDGRSVGQAIALYLDGHHIQVKNCKLYGCQDTLFLAPLPSAPRIPGSFVGPSEHKVYRQLESYFENCYIEGDVDFIFGGGQALFNKCVIQSKNRREKVNGYVTAPSTYEGEDYGFVFYSCNFVAEKGTEAASVYLGRPWREFAQVMLIKCTIGEHIHPEGWNDWNNEENRKTTRFSEYACTYSNKEAIQTRAYHEPFIHVQYQETSIGFLSHWHQACLNN